MVGPTNVDKPSHECTNYDSLLAQVQRDYRGMPGVTEVYDAVVRPHIDLLVDAAMESLTRVREP